MLCYAFISIYDLFWCYYSFHFSGTNTSTMTSLTHLWCRHEPIRDDVVILYYEFTRRH